MKKYTTFYRIFIVITLLAMLFSACVPVEPTAIPPQPTQEVIKPTVAPAQPTKEVVATTAPQEGPVVCPEATVSDNKGLVGATPQQFELAEFESLAGCKLAFTDNPLFTSDITAGKLPSVTDRLPVEPLIVEPYNEIGIYGGNLRGISLGPSSGTTEVFSWRIQTWVHLQDDLKTIVPNLMKSWTVDPTYSEYTFTLRKGHRWSDGTPFTTEDILFWYNDIILNKELFPTVPSPWRQGSEAAIFSAVDEQTFKVTFPKPVPGLLIFLANSPYNYWAPKNFMSQYHISYNPQANEQAIALGYKSWVELFNLYWNQWSDLMDKPETPTLDAYILLSAPTTEQRVRVANPYYYKVDTAGQQLPYINEQTESFIKDSEVINLKVINGEVDMKAQSLTLANFPIYKENEANGDYTVQMPGGFGGMIYAFNGTHTDPILRTLFQDVRFKQAMSLAINRDEINELLYFGLAVPNQAVPNPETSFVEPWMTTYMAEYDPAKANTLLDEIGLVKGSDGFRLRPDGKPLNILMEYSVQAENPKVNELVKEYWGDVGINVQLKEETTADLRANSATNTMDLGVWSYTFYFEPKLIGDPIRLYPAWGDGSQYMAGKPWLDWYRSNGAEGEVPPDEIKELFNLVDQWVTTVPGSDDYIKLGKQIMTINVNNLYLIGTVGQVPGPTIISNKLGNVPTFTVQSSDYSRTLPFRVDQWYFKQ